LRHEGIVAQEGGASDLPTAWDSTEGIHRNRPSASSRLRNMVNQHEERMLREKDRLQHEFWTQKLRLTP
jgi:hypothetical protein